MEGEKAIIVKSLSTLPFKERKLAFKEDAAINEVPGNDESQRGIALIAVLWTIILLSALATALIAMTRSDARLLVAEGSQLEAAEAAEAGLNLTLAALANPTAQLPLDGTAQILHFGAADVTVSVSAETGKVDLNTADPALLQGLLVVAGLGPGEAEKMAEAIVDWRTPGDALQQGFLRGGHHTPFNSIGELTMLPGMTEELFDRLAPNLTLFSGSPSVDPTLASKDVLLAIPGNTQADAEAAFQARSNPTQSVSRAPNLSRIVGYAFSIDAIAHLANGTTSGIREVVRLTGNPRQPFWVLAVH